VVGNGVVADADQRRHRQAPPPSLFDGYAAQYGQLPGHGLTFDVPLSQAAGEAAVLALGGVNAATSTSTIVSGSVPPLSLLIPGTTSCPTYVSFHHGIPIHAEALAAARLGQFQFGRHAQIKITPLGDNSRVAVYSFNLARERVGCRTSKVVNSCG
jgi:hypothetical protein